MPTFSGVEYAKMTSSFYPEALDAWLNAEGYPVDDVEAVLANETTPLMRAAQLGRANIAKALIDGGADVNRLNADRNTALWFACFADDLESIDLLINAGCNLDNQNVNGATPLIYAASAGKTDVVRRLLQSGASVGLETVDGYTALDAAANFTILKLLRTCRVTSDE